MSSGFSILISAIGLLLWTGCATCKVSPKPAREFNISKDAFAFRNELYWEYGYDTNHFWRPHKRQPPPAYALHCFPMARAARCFFYHARFDASLPEIPEPEYKQLVRKIIFRASICPSAPSDRIVIPGFSNLFEFSRKHESLLKTNCGSAARSYFQRGNWRMVFPFTRGNQSKTADSLIRELSEHRLPIVHLVDFPRQRINHSVLIYEVETRPREIVFRFYDPNNPSAPGNLTFSNAITRFSLPQSNYFPGGMVNVYEIEKNFWK
jgi:hypothetical protein